MATISGRHDHDNASAILAVRDDPACRYLVGDLCSVGANTGSSSDRRDGASLLGISWATPESSAIVQLIAIMKVRRKPSMQFIRG
jgi:hypothetical protein